MARSLGTLTADLVVRMGGYKQGMDAAARETAKLERTINQRARGILGSFKSLGGLFATALGGFSLASVIQSTAEAEKAFAQLENAVRTNGGAAGKTAAELADVASGLQSVTTYSDDAIQQMQSLLLRFQSIRGDTFDRTTESALDLSAALGQDLQSTAKALGRALEDPERGLTALSRMGVVFSQQQKELIKDLAGTGRQAEAQGLILDALEERFEGAARAARDNFGGALAGLRNAASDLLEAKSGLPGVTAQINAFTRALEDPRTKQAADSFGSGFLQALAAIGAAIRPVLQGLANMVNTAAEAGTALDLAFGREFAPGDPIVRKLTTIEGRLESLKRRRDELLRVTEGGTLFSRGLTLQLEQIEQQMARLQAMQSNGPTTRSGALGQRRQDRLQVISPDDAELAEKVFEQTRTAAEKFGEEMADLDRLLAKSAITPEVYQRRVAQLRAELEKKPKAVGMSDAARALEQARNSITATIERLQDQAATFGLTDAAALRYSITAGDLSRDLDKLGDSAAPLREKLLGLADAVSDQRATGEINDQIAALREQAATLALTDQQALAYSVTQGELSKVLAQTGDDADDLTRRLLEANNRLAETRREFELIAERQSIFESTRTDAERYAATLEHLGDLFRGSSDQATYGRAVADAAGEFIDASSAAKEYRLVLAELQQQLAGGELTQEAFNAATQRAKETFEKAGRESAETFTDEAKRGTQRLVADFLTNPFSKGIDEVGHELDEMLRGAAANALSQKLADKLFNGFDEWFDKIGDYLADLGQQFAEVFAQSSSAGGGFFGSLASAFGSLFGGSSGGLEDIVVTAKRLAGGGLVGESGGPFGTVPAFAGGGFLSIGARARAIAFADGGSPATVDATGGGRIRGPGTGTSDSVRAITTAGRPLLLSNEEYITRAASVRQPGALSFLNAFNEGRITMRHVTEAFESVREWPRQFAEGGFLGLEPADRQLVPAFATGGQISGSHFGMVGPAGMSAAYAGQVSGRAADDRPTVVNNFAIQAPTGSVSRATQQQIGAEAYRGALRAASRNA